VIKIIGELTTTWLKDHELKDIKDIIWKFRMHSLVLPFYIAFIKLFIFVIYKYSVWKFPLILTFIELLSIFTRDGLEIPNVLPFQDLMAFIDLFYTVM